MTVDNGRAKKGRRASRLSEGGTVRSLDYTIEYSRKKPAAEILCGPRAEPLHRLGIVSAEGVPTNRLYAGDNLGILRALCDDRSVAAKVTLVYIDPPFATGSTFESRDAEHAYQDAATGAA